MTRSWRRPFPWRSLFGWVLPLLLLGIWEILSRQGEAFAYAFVPSKEILRTLFELLANGQLLNNLAATMQTSLSGLVLGGSLGIMTGALMGSYPAIDKLVGPLYHSLRQVPLLGLIPLIGLWFGSGAFSKVLIVSLAAFYPLVLHTFEGIRQVDPRHLEVARVLRLPKWQAFTKLLWPSALPSILSGVAQALAFTWVSTIGVELLFIAGPGLGGLMQTAQAAARMDVVVVCVTSIALTGLAMNTLLSRLSSRWLSWRSVR